MDPSSVDPNHLKRKREDSSLPAPDASSPNPAAKLPKTAGTNQLSINYLARQSQEDLPLVHKDDGLSSLLHLLASYGSVLDRHESLASNLGARPLGPILIKRFERCFDSPPKIVASHHKALVAGPEDATQHITWLEVIEFARSHPSQFSLSTFSEGKRVCQFYYPQKQLRVQITEEDFLFINSGRCQELIPPLPIWEDEEKEVATCDVLEAKLKELTNAADMVAARTRQLSHRLKGRRAAILERRAEGGSGTPAKVGAIQTTTAPPPSVGAGSFTAVNAGGPPNRFGDRSDASLGGSSAVRDDLLRHFESLPQNSDPRSNARHPSVSMTDGGPMRFNGDSNHEHAAASNASSLSPIPSNAFPDEPAPPHRTTESTSTNQRPLSNSNLPQHQISATASATSSSASAAAAAAASLRHNFSRPLPAALESSQPYRPICQAHMDSLPRGQRVLPPCDRCRRLRMDCVKNLTSCAGCTKKHARCHWRDVGSDEVSALEAGFGAGLGIHGGMVNGVVNGGGSGTGRANGYHYGFHGEGSEQDDEEEEDDESNPLEDLEALGEKEEREVAERMREDAEGIKNAKELARQSWNEDGGPMESEHVDGFAGIRESGNLTSQTSEGRRPLDQEGMGARGGGRREVEEEKLVARDDEMKKDATHGSAWNLHPPASTSPSSQRHSTSHAHLPSPPRSTAPGSIVPTNIPITRPTTLPHQASQPLPPPKIMAPTNPENPISQPNPSTASSPLSSSSNPANTKPTNPTSNSTSNPSSTQPILLPPFERIPAANTHPGFRAVNDSLAPNTAALPSPSSLPPPAPPSSASATAGQRTASAAWQAV